MTNNTQECNYSDNVFDFIDEFYTQDSGWNRIMDWNMVTGFIRKLSWQTDDDEQLMKVWNCLMSHIFYLGYSDTLPGDLTPDEAIISVGWCFRNLGDFVPTEDGISFYLDTMVDFYKHLEQMHCITHNASFTYARKKLPKPYPLDAQGFFIGDFEQYNERCIPDLPSKIFVNISSQMVKFLELLENDFIPKTYPKDYSRAKNIFLSFLGEEDKDLSDDENAKQGFLDYLCFDYKLQSTGEPLIFDLYDKISKDFSGKYSYSFKQTLRELTKAKLILFSVKKKLGQGMYSVIDVLRQESLVLCLPIEEEINFKNALFCGHCFCDDSLIVNFIRGMNLSREQQSLLLDVLKKDRKLYALRKGGNCSWDEFISNNQLLVRNLPFLVLRGFTFEKDFDTRIVEYTPDKLPKDDFLKPYLEEIFTTELFSPKDLQLATQLWADLQAVMVPEEERVEVDPSILAVAISRVYVELCGVYKFGRPKNMDETMKAMEKEIKSIVKDIKKTLCIEKYDPRYVNEEGFLVRHIMLNAEK